MTTDERRALRKELEATILREVRDPAGWLQALRRVAEELELQPAACIALPTTLRAGCGDVMTHAEQNSMTAESVRNVLATMRW